MGCVGSRPSFHRVLTLIIVGKVTLDIICSTAFGYSTDSLRNPHNELAQAYAGLVNVHSGRKLAIGLAIHALPGATRLFASEWMYRRRWILRQIPFLSVWVTLRTYHV